MLKHEMVARDIMTKSVRTVNHDGSLKDALTIMDREGFSQMPVMEGEKPVALLTEPDVRRAILQDRQDRPVAELASPLPALVGPGTRISRVMVALQEQDSVLVVSSRDRLEGIITYWDVLELARPYMLVKEVELLLRRVVEAAFEQKYGPDWWRHVSEDLRQRAEEEHEADKQEGDSSPAHMLGHTSLWSLIEIFRSARPDLNGNDFKELHEIRKFRNQVAHLYILTPAEQHELSQRCLRAGDWLQSLLPEAYPLRRGPEKR